MALREVLRLHGDEILLCTHDGWVSRGQLNKNEVERAILSATGFNLQVEEKELTSHWLSQNCKIQENNSQNTNYSDANQWITIFQENFCSSSTCPSSGVLVISTLPAWNRPEGVFGPASKNKTSKKTTGGRLKSEEPQNCGKPAKIWATKSEIGRAHV